MDQKDQFSIYQFQKSFHYPIFLKIKTGPFQQLLYTWLNTYGFSELTAEESKNYFSSNDSIQSPSLRFPRPSLPTQHRKTLLQITEASPKVAAQIGRVIDGDHFGPEKITPQPNYRVYHYQGHALMVYSPSIENWELGLLPSMILKQYEEIYNTLFTRFLGLASAANKLGLIGLWGHPYEDGFFIGKQKEAQSEAIFIDLSKNMLFIKNKAEKLCNYLKIYRFDPSVKNYTAKMTKEELFSYLLARSAYFDYEGPPPHVQRSLFYLSQVAQGFRCSEKKLGQRTDLSY